MRSEVSCPAVPDSAGMPASRNIEEKILRRCAACRGTAYGCDDLLPSGEPREVCLSVGYQQEGMLAVKRST